MSDGAGLSGQDAAAKEERSGDTDRGMVSTNRRGGSDVEARAE
jgi:hypothetical protein